MGSTAAALLRLLRLLPLLLALLGPGSSEDVNVLVGTTVELKITYSGKSTGYTWTKGSTRVAEWDDPGKVTYYESLKGRCDLDTSTGVLTIKDLKEEDSARYKGEALVNNLYVSSNYDLRVFPSLNNPTVTCDLIGGNYTIFCDHQPERPINTWSNKVGLVEGKDYWLSNFKKNLTLTNTKVPFQSLECVVQNPVSKESAPVPQDCFKGLIDNEEITAHRRYGLIIVAVIAILAVCIGIFLWRKFGKILPQCLSRHVNAEDSAEQNPLLPESIENVNAHVGATIWLKLKYTGDAKGYIWTKGNDKIAEWHSPGEVSYHDALQDRCELSTLTGDLTIRDLREADSSMYKGEAILDSGSSATDIHLNVCDKSADQEPGNGVPQSGSGEGGNADEPEQGSLLQVSDPKNEEKEVDGEQVNHRSPSQHSLSSGDQRDETSDTKV